MHRWALATAATLLLTVTACGSADPSEGDDAAPGDQSQGEAPLVPVERSTELVDPEGSVLGTAWLRDADSGGIAELEVQVAGLSQGFHGMHLYAVGGCDDVELEAPATLLPPMLVLENGIGSITTLVGPVSLDELLDGGGATVVINNAVEGAAEGLQPANSGSRVACGAFVQ